MNAITNFEQFHTALTGIANHQLIGVVPTGINGFPAFGAIGEPLARVPSPVQIDFSRPRLEFDAEAFARTHDDTELLEEIWNIRTVLETRLGDLFPDDIFFGTPITKVQAVRRDQIKLQVTHPLGDASKFSDMTVEDVARRLATKSYLQGGGYGHMDLIHALFDMSRVVRDNNGNRDHLVAAGIMLANINSPHALAMAEFALGEAALEKDFMGAAILLGLAADVRDMRAGGVEPDNPIRATAASRWFALMHEADVNIGARLFFGMSETLRAGNYSLYTAFAALGAGMPISKIDHRIGAPYLARYLWAKSEDINRQGEAAEVDDNFWIEMEEGLSDVGEVFHHGRGIEGMKLSAECWILRDGIKLMRGV